MIPFMQILPLFFKYFTLVFLVFLVIVASLYVHVLWSRKKDLWQFGGTEKLYCKVRS